MMQLHRADISGVNSATAVGVLVTHPWAAAMLTVTLASMSALDTAMNARFATRVKCLPQTRIRPWMMSAGTKLHTFVSGCVPGAVSGPHTLDETYVGLLTGDNSLTYYEPAHAALAELSL